MQLNYRKYGADKSGIPLLILHGLLGSSQNWHSLAQTLAAQYPVLVPDLRNHGESPHGEHRIELIVQDILELFETEQIRRAFVVGHSMGGLAAMMLAFANPELLEGVVVVDIAPGTITANFRTIFDALMRLDLSQLKTREDADRDLSASIENLRVRQFLLQNLKRQPDGRFAWKCNLPELQRFVNDPKRFRIADHQYYAGPTLFIAGERSEYRIWERTDTIRKHFPRAEMRIVPGAGHWVHFDAPAEFVKILREFVDKNS